MEYGLSQFLNVVYLYGNRCKSYYNNSLGLVIVEY